MDQKFVRKKKQIDSVEACIPLFRRRIRGEIVPFEEIESTSGFSRHSSDWNLMVKHLKKKLRREFGVQIDATYNGGYRLLPAPEQCNEFVRKQFRFAKRRLSLGEEAAVHAPDELLSDHEQRLKHAMLEKLGNSYSVMSTHVALASAIMPKKDN